MNSNKRCTLALVALVVMTGACGKSGSNPVGPTQKDGYVTFTYFRDQPCTRSCDKKVHFGAYCGSISGCWPDIYRSQANGKEWETDDGGKTWHISVLTPGGLTLGVAALDPNERDGLGTAKRMSANGVRLPDQVEVTYFLYTPPDSISPRNP